jgi:hypothetical protein
MINAKILAEATISISFPCPVVENGELHFCEVVESYQLNNFKVPGHLGTSEDIKEYLNDLLDQSSCDIASIESVTL